VSDGYLKGITDGGEECECHKCSDTKVMNKLSVHSLFNLVATMMVLCGECGNKRCPKASDHSLACTHSNAPGQSGSVYE